MKGEIEAAVINEIIELLEKLDINEKKLNNIINKLQNKFKV